MSDYCIENDFAAQREIAERERDTITKLRAEVKELRARYNDLVMQVACKFQGETRHDTAKRYIVERENREVACCKEVDG